MQMSIQWSSAREIFAKLSKVGARGPVTSAGAPQTRPHSQTVAPPQQLLIAFSGRVRGAARRVTIFGAQDRARRARSFISRD
jgi:hypothetical protein